MVDLLEGDFVETYGKNGRSLQPARWQDNDTIREVSKAIHVLNEAGLSEKSARVMLQEAGLGSTPPENEFGVASFGTVDFNGELQDDQQQVTVDKLQRMTRFDGQAKALLNILTMPIRTAKWRIVASENGKREAKFVENMLRLPPHRGGMAVPFNVTLGYLALAIRDRFKVVEKIWELQRVDGTLRWVIKKLALRPTETLTLKVDSKGDLIGVRQKTMFHGNTIDTVMPASKVLLYTYGKEEGPLVGESAFNAAHYHYDKKHKLYYIAHIAYSSAALPPKVGTIPNNRGHGSPKRFKEDLANLGGLNSAMVKPEGWEVETLQLNRSFSDFLPLINHHDFMMAISVLAQFLRLGQTGVGSFALSENQSDAFILAMQHFLDDIAKTITSFLIPQVIDLNFGSGRYPRFVFETLSDKATALLREVFGKIAVSASSQVQPEFMLELEKKMAESMGINVDYEAIEKEIEEMATAKRASELERLENSPDLQPAPVPGAQAPKPKPSGGASNGNR